MSQTYLFNYHQRMYSLFTGNKVNMKNSGGGAIAFYNGQIKRIKDSTGYDVEGVKALILFAFVHNPLKYEDCAGYGRVASLCECISSFVEWRKAHKREIVENGLISTIMKLKPVQSELGKELEDQIEEAFAL